MLKSIIPLNNIHNILPMNNYISLLIYKIWNIQI
jgi:hypothetical protein